MTFNLKNQECPTYHSQNQTDFLSVALVPHLCCSCRTGISVALVLHLCRLCLIRVARVTLAVARVRYSCCKID